MKLTKLEIEAFRSIRERQVLHIDPSVTVLIGANDHGKTNLLEAIRSINTDRPFTEQDKNWDTDDPAKIKITYHFILDAEEIKKVQKLIETEVNQPKTAAVIAGSVEVVPIGNHYIPPAEEVEKITFTRSGVGGQLQVTGPERVVAVKTAKDFVVGCIPRVELFEPVASNIKDSITKEELALPANEFMQGIFRKAGLWDNRDKVFAQNPRTEKLLAEASQKLTEQIQSEWEQGRELKFLLSHTTGGIALRIHDPAVTNTYVLPSQRSSGFSAFFVLHFRLFARQEANPANRYIFVFDEPGTYLHPKGQVNLVRVFETLSQKNQLAYATHSIFMVNKNEPTRHRVVLKSASGTVVDQKPYLNNWKSVRSSLGLFFSNNFFFADATLLVEGPSDVLYVLSILKTLGHFAKVDVDLNLFSIRDGGTPRDYYAMAKLMADEGRKVVALIDGDEGGKARKQELEKLNRHLEQDNKIEIISLLDNKSIEDYVPYQDLLMESVASSCDELVRDEIRSYARGLDRSQVLEKAKQVIVKRDSSKTLGKLLEELTSDFFNPKDKVSKLQTARNYEDLAERRIADKSATFQDCPLTLKLANEIKEKLDLKSREAQKRIFSPTP